LLPRLATGVGLVLAAGEEARTEDGEEDPGAPDEARPAAAGAGRVAGLGTGWVPPGPASPEAFAEGGPDVPASRPGHGMNDARGPPSSPAAIIVRQASSPAHTPMPNRRIRLRRRPETSVNTGARAAGGRVLRLGTVGISDRQTQPPPIVLRAAGQALQAGLSGRARRLPSASLTPPRALRLLVVGMGAIVAARPADRLVTEARLLGQPWARVGEVAADAG
jgi:hypothetical protein